MYSVAEVIRIAETYLRGSIPGASYRSLPIPSSASSELSLCFFIGRGEAINAELKYHIWPPQYLASFALRDGTFQELYAITPTDFSLPDDIEQPLGPGIAPPLKQTDSYKAKFITYCQALDALLPAYARLTSISASSLKAAANFEELLPQMGEQAIQKYVEAVGEPFFSWLRSELSSR